VKPASLRKCYLPWQALVMPSNWAASTFDETPVLIMLYTFQHTTAASVERTRKLFQALLDA